MKIIEYLCENPTVAEVILGLVQVLSPFIVLVITLHDERKQNAEFKKQEVKMQYLKECMSWLNELQMMAYIVSRTGFKCLCTYDLEEIDKHYKSFNMEASIMCEKCTTGISIYNTMAKSLGITIDLEEVRRLTNDFTQTVRDNCRVVPTDESVDKAVDIINGNTQYFEKEIELSIAEVGKVLAAILERK